MAAAQACPNIDLTGQSINQSAQALAAGQTFPVVAGGNIDTSQCMDVPGVGFVADAPDFELSLSGSAGAQDLELAVVADCDATLLINDATGEWQYGDDADGTFNPRVVIPAAADGVYDIWVGSYDSASCNATLRVQTYGSGDGPAADRPDDGRHRRMPRPLASGGGATGIRHEPASHAASAGGRGRRRHVSGGCAEIPGSGYIIQNPDFELALSGNAQGQDMEVRLTSACDTVLLVNDATGEWQFVDDAEGTLNPVVVIPAAMDGVYDIWVGTLAEENCDATFSIAAVGAAVPGKGGGAAPAPAPAPEPAPAPAPAPGKGGGDAPAPAPAPAGDLGAAQPDPGNLTAFRAQVGAVLVFEVTGSTDGFVWGTDIYTDDSDLSTAAVHAGVLAPGETGIISVEMTGPQTGFTAGNRNGVNASAFGSWGGSYRFNAG